MLLSLYSIAHPPAEEQEEPQEEIEEITGKIVTFQSDGTAPKSLTLSLTPTQAGSGTPSPSNIRKLSGYTSVTVTRTGKNLWGGAAILRDVKEAISSATVNTANQSVSFVASQTSGKKPFFTIFKENTRYTFCGTLQNSSRYTNVRWLFSDSTYNGTRQIPNTSKNTMNLVSNDKEASLIGFGGTHQGGTTTIYAAESGMFEGVLTAEETAPYISYQGETYTITFPQEAGTVYGADIDLLAGTLTVTMGYIASYAGEELPGAWVSDRDVYAEGAVPTTGAQVVYRLATPVTYSLDEIGFTALEGENNVWGNHGEVTAGVLKEETSSALQAAPLLGAPLTGGLLGGGLLGGGLLGASPATLPEDLFDPIVCEEEPPEPPEIVPPEEMEEWEALNEETE